MGAPIKIIAIAAAILINLSSYAVSFEDPEFKDFIKSAEFVGLVELVSITPIKPQEESGKNSCYLVEANVTESFKGPKSRITFTVEQRNDILDGHERYFLIAFEAKKERLLRREGLTSRCNIVDVDYKTSSTWQTVFPFGVQADQWVGDSTLLANRRSVFSHNAYYTKDEYVDHFVILGERIYAAIEWRSVKEKITGLLQ